MSSYKQFAAKQKSTFCSQTYLFIYLFSPQTQASLIFLGFFSVCFSGVCLIYGFINFPRTFASSMIFLCFPTGNETKSGA